MDRADMTPTLKQWAALAITAASIAGLMFIFTALVG